MKPFDFILVNGCTWEIYLLSKKTWLKYFHKDIDGCVAPKEQAIYFRTDKLSEETIRHELFHVYFESYPLSGDIEERAAEIFALYAPWIVSQTKALWECYRDR